MLRYLGIALLVIASQRELSMGKIRPDALLQAFLLLAIAALLTHLANGRLRYAALMGVALGCAYLTKSFAFVFAFLCIIALAVFRWIWLKHSQCESLAAALVALLCFAVVAGPYVAALSIQRRRFDFGDSGALNYAWYVGGTEKMHLTALPDRAVWLLRGRSQASGARAAASPLILSYAEMPYGTYPGLVRHDVLERADQAALQARRRHPACCAQLRPGGPLPLQPSRGAGAAGVAAGAGRADEA